jgi:ABC-type branched-subunit amino acid transport system ATPase component
VTPPLRKSISLTSLETADFGYVLETGEIVQSGPAGTLIHDPKLIAAYRGGHQAAAPASIG